MSNHAILTHDDHRATRVLTGSSAELGDGVMACYTIPEEFRRLQNEFPILFRRDAEGRSFSSLVLLGFEAGENLFLEGDVWTARYKPLSLSVQPFLIGRSADEDDGSQLHIDLDHPRLSKDGDGTLLFDEQGLPTPYLDGIAGQLAALDQGFRLSPAFFAALERYELLEPFALDVELNNGAKHRMVGYHLINEDRLASLESEELGELQAAGYLGPIFMAVASLSNLGKLIERKNRRLHHG